MCRYWLSICIFFGKIYADNRRAICIYLTILFRWGLLPAEIVNLTATITAFNAISDTRKESNKSIYTELEKIARVQSVKGSNAIEGIVTTDARIKQIVDGDSAPLNHDEREIAGYRDALGWDTF